MGPRVIHDLFRLYFRGFPKITRVAMRRGQFWENFETTREINPESPEGTYVYLFIT